MMIRPIPGEYTGEIIQAILDGRAIYYYDINGDLYQLVSSKKREQEEKRFRKTFFTTLIHFIKRIYK